MTTKRIWAYTAVLVGVLAFFTGCMRYTLSGASIHADAKTVSIPYFPNTSTLVLSSLSPTFTDALQEKFANETKLSLVYDDNADFVFSGAIVHTASTPTAITADDKFPASQNRLTVTVRVQFTNRLEPEYSFQSKTFSHYVDYDSNQSLQSKESELVPIVVKMLVDDIYMAAVANW